MVNRLFSFLSQGSGVALAAMAVGVMSLHAQDGVMDAGINAWAAVANGQNGSMHEIMPDATKTDSTPSIYVGTGRPPV